MPLNTPRLSRCLANLAKNPSTALSQDADVGVKWKWNPGCRSSQARTFGCVARTHHVLQPFPITGTKPDFNTLSHPPSIAYPRPLRNPLLVLFH